MFKLLKQLFCNHDNCQTITNVYGDAINRLGCRSIKKCVKCGKVIKSDILDDNCPYINKFK